MKLPFYIQRLQMPYEGHEKNPFSFGGGLVRGGLTEEAMNLIKDIFSFDYMGAAEFEWGAVPSALNSLSELSIDKKLVAYAIKGEAIKDTETTVYIICPKEIKDDVTKWITVIMENEFSFNLKEYLNFGQAIQGGRTQGWLKIENDRHCEEPFMFFTNEKMFNNMSKLLEL